MRASRLIRSRRPVGAAIAPPFAEQIRFYVVAALLVLCAVGGGASRTDVVSLIYLRPAVVLCIAVLVALPGSWDFRGLRVLFLLHGAFAATMLVQLIPLPPDIWLALPGHARFAEAAEAAGMAQPWRPISLTPELTLHSLLALLFPLAVLLGFAGTRRERHADLIPLLILLACASALLGIVQVTDGAGSPAFLYRITHEGAAVGFFANRNHQAALLAMTFPLLRVWTLMPGGGPIPRRARIGIALGLSLFLLPMLLVTGSRAGIALGIIGLAAAYFLSPWEGRAGARTTPATVARLIMGFMAILLVGTALLLGRAIAIQRLAALQDINADLRFSMIRPMLRIIGDFLPLGSGFGSFDPIFRVYEPDYALAPTYFNHAHNDLIELVLTGGVPALAVLLGFLLWWGRRSAAAWLPLRERGARGSLPRLGSVMILILFAASLVDYPLRTPLMAAIFAIACGLLARAPLGDAAPPRPEAAERVH